MAGSTTEETAPASTAETPNQESTVSTGAVEEMKKEFSQNNQHNVPRDKKKSEDVSRRTFRGARNKKEYQRSRGRNKR